jgi:hypothetical protein
MPRSVYIALAAFCIATVLLVPLAWYIPGFAFWLLSAVLTFRQRDPRVRRNLAFSWDASPCSRSRPSIPVSTRDALPFSSAASLP